MKKRGFMSGFSRIAYCRPTFNRKCVLLKRSWDEVCRIVCGNDPCKKKPGCK